MWAAKQAPSAARAAAQSARAAVKTTTPRASTSTRQLCSASPASSSVASTSARRVSAASRQWSSSYHTSASGPFAPSSSALARDRRGIPNDDLEVVDEVVEDELDGDDLFGGTTTEVDANPAGAPSGPDSERAMPASAKHNFQDLVAIMRESLFRFEKRETQNAPSRQLLSTIFQRASSLEELRDALACARLYMQLWYYRSKSFSKVSEISTQYFVDTCIKLNYPELALNALAHPLDTGFVANRQYIAKLQSALTEKLRLVRGKADEVDPQAKELLLESPTLEGTPQPLKEWNGTPEGFKAGSGSSSSSLPDAGEDVSPGEAEAVAEGEGATPENSVPETQSAADDQAQVALDRARLSIVDRLMVAAALSSTTQTDARLVDDQLMMRALSATANASKLEPEMASVTALHRYELFPRIDAMVKQLAAQMEMHKSMKSGEAAESKVDRFSRSTIQAGAGALAQARLRLRLEKKAKADQKYISRAIANVETVRNVMLNGIGQDASARSKFERQVTRLQLGPNAAAAEAQKAASA